MSLFLGESLDACIGNFVKIISAHLDHAITDHAIVPVIPSAFGPEPGGRRGSVI